MAKLARWQEENENARHVGRHFLWMNLLEFEVVSTLAAMANNLIGGVQIAKPSRVSKCLKGKEK